MSPPSHARGKASPVPQHIFYSWQADTASACGKNLVSRALGDAIEALNVDADVEAAARESRDERIALDQDTSGEPGSPPIVETIFGKIDRAAAFVSDLTFVAARSDGRLMPNPNVLLEHGWALKSLSWRAVISVMNIAHGHPKDHSLPFDLQHFRGPIFFECPDDADDAVRGAARKALAKALVPKLRAILDDAVLCDARRPPAAAEPHPHDLELVARWRASLRDPLRRFLRDHDFNEAYRRKLLHPLHEIDAQWHGAQYELDDAELDRAFRAFHKANRAFCALLAERTHALDGNSELASAKTNLDATFGLQSGTRDAIVRLNLAARTLNDVIDGVEREIRIRIRAVVEPLVVPPDPRREPAQAALGELAADRFRGGVPQIVSRPRMTLRIAPLAAFDGKRLDPGAVARAQGRFPPDPMVRVEEGSDARQWWTCAIATARQGMNPETLWLARLVRPGLLEAEVTIGSRIDDDPQIVVEGEALERGIIFWLERLASTLPALELEGPGLIEVSFDDMVDVELHRARPGGRRIGQPQLQLPVVAIEDLSARLAPDFREAFDILWQAAGWRDGSPSFASGSWAGYREA
jgi:hypothetical protein